MASTALYCVCLAKSQPWLSSLCADFMPVPRWLNGARERRSMLTRLTSRSQPLTSGGPSGLPHSPAQQTPVCSSGPLNSTPFFLSNLSHFLPYSPSQLIPRFLVSEKKDGQQRCASCLVGIFLVSAHRPNPVCDTSPAWVVCLPLPWGPALMPESPFPPTESLLSSPSVGHPSVKLFLSVSK